MTPPVHDASADEGAGAAPEIDLDRMAEVAAGCGWSLAEMVAFYVPRARRELADIVQAWAERDLERVARLTHGAAGSSATVGIDSMAALFRTASARARASGAPELHASLGPLIDGLGTHLELVFARLDELAAPDR